MCFALLDDLVNHVQIFGYWRLDPVEQIAQMSQQSTEIRQGRVVYGDGVCL